MGTIYSPSELGFSSEFHEADRCQVALLRSVAAVSAGRLLVKGGMAMRVAFGSMRLTKDIDFDRVDSMSVQSAKSAVSRGMQVAAQVAGVRNLSIDVTKETGTTIRMRMRGVCQGGEAIRFETEVSGRDSGLTKYRQTVAVVPPPQYGMAPFNVETFTPPAIAAQKVAAVLSAARNVPRDVYDLKDLIAAGADPTTILADLPSASLEALHVDVVGKLLQIDFDLARDQLLPYIPPFERESVSEQVWDGYLSTVAENLSRWLGQAEALQAGRAGGEPPTARRAKP